MRKLSVAGARTVCPHSYNGLCFSLLTSHFGLIYEDTMAKGLRLGLVAAFALFPSARSLGAQIANFYRGPGPAYLGPVRAASRTLHLDSI
jgi:hypothetical protein